MLQYTPLVLVIFCACERVFHVASYPGSFPLSARERAWVRGYVPRTLKIGNFCPPITLREMTPELLYNKQFHSQFCQLPKHPGWHALPPDIIPEVSRCLSILQLSTSIKILRIEWNCKNSTTRKIFTQIIFNMKISHSMIGAYAGVKKNYWIFINNNSNSENEHTASWANSLESGESAKGVTGSTVSMVASTTTFRRSEGRGWEWGYSNVVSTF